MKYSKELHEQLRKRYKDSDSSYVQCLLDEIERLQAERRWTPVGEELPENNKTYEIWANEFGLGGGLAIAKCFISSEHPDDPRWYFDMDAYGLERPYQVAQTVTHYREIIPPEEK